MQLILSAISAGGLAGAADQYLCLLIVSVAAKTGLVTISSQMSFLESWWFIGVAAIFWIITVAPSYASLFSPGVMHVINTVANFISGFIVPLSSAILSLAAVGIITNLNPDLKSLIDSLRIFDANGGIGVGGAAIAGAGAMTGVVLTGMRGLAKPGLSATTGTTGTVAAPIYTTVENLASVILMALVFFFSRIDPWLIVVLAVVMLLLTVGLLVFAIYQLWRLKKGIGRVMYLVQTRPRAGLAIIAEFFLWGSGWLVWGVFGRGFLMLILLALWVFVFLFAQPAFVALFVFFPPIMPAVAVVSIILLIFLYLAIGLGSAQALFRHVDKNDPEKTAVVTT